MLRWYLLDISTLEESEYRNWYALMDQEKKRKVDAFRFVKDKKQTVFSEMLVRLALAQTAGCTPESIVFSTHSNGKPFSKGLELEFNASHCGRWITCAVCDKPVGIDLEQIRPVSNRLIRYVCSEREYAFVMGDAAMSPTDTVADRTVLERFFRLWTAKEAFVKYTGTGLTGKIKQIPWEESKIHCIILEDHVLSICCDFGYTGTITQGDVKELVNTPYLEIN